MARTFSTSGFNPDSDTIFPMYLTSLTLYWSFAGLNFTFASRALCSSFLMISSCSWSSLAAIIVSTNMTSTPSMSPNMASFLFWKTSGAELIPNGIVLKR